VTTDLPIPAKPEQLRLLALRLRGITPAAAKRPLEQSLSGRSLRVIIEALEELAGIGAGPGTRRERLLQSRNDSLAIFATSRRIPLAAVEALVRRAEAAGGHTVDVAQLRAALSRTEDDE
jgi:hypothetical protein